MLSSSILLKYPVAAIVVALPLIRRVPAESYTAQTLVPAVFARTEVNLIVLEISALVLSYWNVRSLAVSVISGGLAPVTPVLDLESEKTWSIVALLGT